MAPIRPIVLLALAWIICAADTPGALTGVSASLLMRRSIDAHGKLNAWHEIYTRWAKWDNVQETCERWERRRPDSTSGATDVWTSTTDATENGNGVGGMYIVTKGGAWILPPPPGAKLAVELAYKREWAQNPTSPKFYSLLVQPAKFDGDRTYSYASKQPSGGAEAEIEETAPPQAMKRILEDLGLEGEAAAKLAGGQVQFIVRRRIRISDSYQVGFELATTTDETVYRERRNRFTPVTEIPDGLFDVNAYGRKVVVAESLSEAKKILQKAAP